MKSPEPVIRVNELAVSSVNFVCRPRVRTADYWDVYWDLTRSMKERFDKEGLSIPFPQRDVRLIQNIPVSAGNQAPAEKGKPIGAPDRNSRPVSGTDSVDDQLRKSPEMNGDDALDDLG